MVLINYVLKRVIKIIALSINFFIYKINLLFNIDPFYMNSEEFYEQYTAKFDLQ